jgi:hypothetical protein
VWVAGVVAQGSGEVGWSRPAQHADGQVAQGCHHAWAAAGAELGGVLGEGDIADMMQRFDRPVPTQQVGQAGGTGQLEGEAGDRIHGHGPPSGGVQVAGLAGDLEDLGGVREPEVADADHLEGAQLDAAVAAVAGAVGPGHAVPRQAGAARQQRGLVGHDHKQVGGPLSGHQELGGLGVGL